MRFFIRLCKITLFRGERQRESRRFTDFETAGRRDGRDNGGRTGRAVGAVALVVSGLRLGARNGGEREGRGEENGYVDSGFHRESLKCQGERIERPRRWRLSGYWAGKRSCVVVARGLDMRTW